jgi:hypothetical protein
VNLKDPPTSKFIALSLLLLPLISSLLKPLSVIELLN